jgi:hypothetical protein
MTQNEVRVKSPGELNPKEGGDELPEPITKQPAADGQDTKDVEDASSTKAPKKQPEGD